MKIMIPLCFSNLPQPTKGGKKKKELNNGNGRRALQKVEGAKKEGGLKLEVSEWIGKKGKGWRVDGVELVNQEEGKLGWFWFSYKWNSTLNPKCFFL
jgi:hypothetical protein